MNESRLDRSTMQCGSPASVRSSGFVEAETEAVQTGFDFGDSPVIDAEVVTEARVTEGTNLVGPLQTLSFEGILYKIVDGRPRIALSSVCKRLSVKDPAMIVRRIPEKWRGKDTFQTRGGPQEMWYVTWEGFALVCQRSDKQEAIPLQDKMAELLGAWIRGKAITIVPPAASQTEHALARWDHEERLAAMLAPMFKENAAAVVAGLAPVLRELIRPDLIVDTNDRVQRVEGGMDRTYAAVKDMSDRLPIQRKDLEVETIETHRQCCRQFTNGCCPRCRFARIIDEHGKWIPGAYQMDHWYRRDKNKLRETWPLCVACHAAVTADASLRDEWSHNWWGYLELIELIEAPLLRGA